jgi:hypothetical protein
MKYLQYSSNFHQSCFINLRHTPFRMPKQNKKSEGKGKGKRTKVNAVIAGADDDFDDMLAELRAADVTAESATSSKCSASSSSSTPTSSSSTTSRVPAAAAEKVSEDALVGACILGDISQLRRWVRRGIRVTSVKPLCDAVQHGNYEIAQCLVRELGADVNQANTEDYSPLCIASQLSNLRMVQFLATELGADVNQTDAGGLTPAFVAAQKGHMAVMRYLVKERGAHVIKANNEGCFPLLIAAQKGHLAVTWL